MTLPLRGVSINGLMTMRTNLWNRHHRRNANPGLRHAAAGLLGVLLVLGLVGVASTAHAQRDATYRIGARDVLRVDISSRPDLSAQYTVTDAGTITVKGLGLIRAAGLTTNELADDLARRFSLIDREIPRVTITLLVSRGRQIAVLGAVALPGLYSLPENGTAWSAIELAGGAMDDADLTAVEIIPGDIGEGRQTVTVNVAAAIRERRLENLDKIQPGDTVRVPRKAGTGPDPGRLVYIFGAVGHQGAVSLDQAPDLMSLVLLSGGPGGDADMRRVEIVRRSGERYAHLTVNLQGYLKTSNPSGNVGLQSGDTVYLPRRERRNYFFDVLGIVSPALALVTTVIAITRR